MHGHGKLLTFESDKQFDRGNRPMLFIGTFINGKKEGKGRTIHTNGQVEEGMWKENLLIFKNPPDLQTYEDMELAAKEIVQF